jgi:hypothetical protein
MRYNKVVFLKAMCVYDSCETINNSLKEYFLSL